MSGIERIAAERRRQVEEEGWTAEHDAEHLGNEMAMAASSYLAAVTDPGFFGPNGEGGAPVDWPWDEEWWKPSDDPIRNLEKAGALIAAEIDRLERGAASA